MVVLAPFVVVTNSPVVVLDGATFPLVGFAACVASEDVTVDDAAPDGSPEPLDLVESVVESSLAVPLGVEVVVRKEWVDTAVFCLGYKALRAAVDDIARE